MTQPAPASDDLLDDERIRTVLGDAAHAYVAIATRSGPHVTPEVHFAYGGRIWLLVAADTVKAKVLGVRPQVGVVARAGGDVVVLGEARQLDMRRPGEWKDSLPEAALGAFATAGYVARNAKDLAGYVRDAFTGRMGENAASPPVLLSVRPQAVAVIDGGDLVHAAGEWASTPEAPGPPAHEPAPSPSRGDSKGLPLDGLPADTAALLHGSRDCVVGWDSSQGPVALPARWHPERAAATIAKELFELAGLRPTGGACLTVDVIEAHRPTAKHGVVLRGQGAATTSDERTVEVRIDVTKLTWWHGAETQTIEPDGGARSA